MRFWSHIGRGDSPGVPARTPSRATVGAMVATCGPPPADSRVAVLPVALRLIEQAAQQLGQHVAGQANLCAAACRLGLGELFVDGSAQRRAFF